MRKLDSLQLLFAVVGIFILGGIAFFLFIGWTVYRVENRGHQLASSLGAISHSEWMALHAAAEDLHQEVYSKRDLRMRTGELEPILREFGFDHVSLRENRVEFRYGGGFVSNVAGAKFVFAPEESGFQGVEYFGGRYYGRIQIPHPEGPLWERWRKMETTPYGWHRMPVDDQRRFVEKFNQRYTVSHHSEAATLDDLVEVLESAGLEQQISLDIRLEEDAIPGTAAISWEDQPWIQAVADLANAFDLMWTITNDSELSVALWQATPRDR